MARYSWATDIHLDHLGGDNQKLIRFGESLVKDNPSGVFLTGDLSIANQLIFHLAALERIVQRPVYFVLGNHDYYGAPIEPLRQRMRELTNVSPFLRYMPTMPYYSLTPATAVVGHDCWYDANHGDWQNSSFHMADWTAIHDFLPVNGNRATIVSQARLLAHAGVKHIHDGIKAATKYHKNIVVLTHFPPFPQAHIHEGQVGDNSALPWYTNKMLGDVMTDASKSFPGVNFTVLAGHTHGKATYQAAANLRVHVGGAEYGNPQLQGLIDVA
jgi:Icc protein